VPTLKSLLPFWRHPVPAVESAPAPLPGRPDDFGKASSFELLFNRLMDNPEAPRDTLFPPKSCR
jgi:hypothetical protein